MYAGSCLASWWEPPACTVRRRYFWIAMPKIGIMGSLVWDLIYGRDPLAPPVEEWGGIAYALAGLDASLSPDWELVPLIKVGRDLSPQAHELLRSLSRLAPGARCAEVTAPNNR